MDLIFLSALHLVFFTMSLSVSMTIDLVDKSWLNFTNSKIYLSSLLCLFVSSMSVSVSVNVLLTLGST